MNIEDLEPLGSLGDRWMRILSGLDPEFHTWAEFVFLAWGDHELPDIVAALEDGEAEFIFEEEFAMLAAELPRTALLDRIHALRRQIRNLDLQAHLRPHRSIKKGAANDQERARTRQAIPRALSTQVEWQRRIKQVRWDVFPDDQVIPRLPEALSKPTFVVAHLFSGRRRQGDVHDALDKWARHFNIDLHIMSLDAAVDVELCNLDHCGEAWQNLLRCYSSGRVAEALIGSPCELYSEARRTPPPEGVDQASWPRPNRSAARLFGLDALTLKEYRRLHVGSLFFLQGLIALCHRIIMGGLYISEHPAAPHDADRASIWTSGLLRVLRQHPDVHLHTFPQYLWDAEVVKPTGLLALRLPNFRSTMFAQANLNNPRPSAVAIGKHGDGTFKTAAHKEYPARFCNVLAFSFATQPKSAAQGNALRVADSCSPEVAEWRRRIVQASAQIRAGAGCLPDFQG